MFNNSYFKMSSYLNAKKKSIGNGIFCNVSLDAQDIGKRFRDFNGNIIAMSGKMATNRYKEGNHYLLRLSANLYLDCQANALANICLASRCNQTTGLKDCFGKSIQPHLKIVFSSNGAYLQILRTARANEELLTLYYALNPVD